MITNYRQTWIEFRKTDAYRDCRDALLEKGIKQQYADNILKVAFIAGWADRPIEPKQNKA